MTLLNPSTFARSAFASLVAFDMACFAPSARANCVTALPTGLSDRRCQHGFACLKTSAGEGHLRGEIRDRNTCGALIVDAFRYRAKEFLPHGEPFTVAMLC